MKCSNCKKEETWLEMIGSNFICPRCLQKHKIIGLVFRTNTKAFKRLIKKLKPKDYSEYMKITRKQVESAFDLRKYGIKLKTTNVVELE
ncbi:hypothetical protein GF361_03230 [Candidatus Woesearchaeota archaeon]|nr:hypothetical protein [Candidatus Woesearchaeota archaeon]